MITHWNKKIQIRGVPSGTMKLHGQAQDPPNMIALAVILIHLSPAPSGKINTNTSIMCKEA